MSKDALSSASPSVRRRQFPPEFDFTKRYNRTESKGEDQKKSSDEELKASVVDTESSSSHQQHQFESLFNPRPAGSSGLPSLLSFSNTSPQRRLPPEDDPFYKSQ